MDLDQKGYCMAEYIWIDGMNGVRSKTKVRVLLVTPTYLQPQCRLPAIFGAGEDTEALLSGKLVTRLGTELVFACHRIPNGCKCLVLLLTLSLSTDTRQALQGR